MNRSADGANCDDTTLSRKMLYWNAAHALFNIASRLLSLVSADLTMVLSTQLWFTARTCLHFANSSRTEVATSIGLCLQFSLIWYVAEDWFTSRKDSGPRLNFGKTIIVTEFAIFLYTA